MTIAIIGSPTRTSVLIADAWQAVGVDAVVLAPQDAARSLRPGDVVLFRLDVLPTLDGVEPGLDVASMLEEKGVRTLNRAGPLLATHDKLETARVLGDAGIAHPHTGHLTGSVRTTSLAFPCVVKPRFGSWGEDVLVCRTPTELEQTLHSIADRPWWIRHGALVQELVAPVTHDLRLVVAGSTVVAGATRTAAPGEWRTNVSLGGRVAPTEVDSDAADLAIQAARAIDIDLVGVDLLPAGDGWIVLELNGAVDFDRGYSLPGTDAFEEILDALALGPRRAVRAPLPNQEATMAKTVKGTPPRPGDEIVITGHAVGDAPRTARILDVLGEPGRQRYHVRWEDGHESIYFPGEDAVVRRPRGKRQASRA